MVVDTKADKRQHLREGVALAAQVSSAEMIADCTVLNITLGGAKIRIAEALPAGQTLTLNVDRFGRFPGRARWRSRDELGLQFDEDSGMTGDTLMAMALYSS